MSEANDLIERAEAETGNRIDDNGGDNMAIDCLVGAMSRLMGQSPLAYRDRDDLAAGILIKHQASPEYKRLQEAREMIAAMLARGVSPDQIQGLYNALGRAGK